MGYSKDYILDTISPNKIIRYLKENGWHLIENKNESPNYLFAKIDNEFEQLTVPKKKGHSLSYQALITDIIYDISDNNKISKDEVINNIINVDKYILNIRYANSTMINNNIPASALYELLDNTKKLYLNAFADTNLKEEFKTAYRRGKFSDQVKTLEKNLEFGQTATGSYVIPMLIPKEDVNYELHDGDLFDSQNYDFTKETGNEEFLDSTGKAIVNMIEKIEIVKKSIDENKDLDDLVNLKSNDFISVDYLNSLSNIGDNQDSTTIEFFSSIKISGDKNFIKSDFTNKYKNKVNQFVEKYKKANKSDNIFTGKLYKLTVDKPDVIDRKLLIVSLEGQSIDSSNSKLQRLTCEFEYDEFKDIIFNAIEQGLTVKVIGDRVGQKLINCKAEIIK